MILFFVSVRPMNSAMLNNLELMNETTLIICSVMLYLFTDYVDDP
jgi:hypothetical protein